MISEQWVQEVATAAKLPPLHPSAAKTLAQITESQIRILLQKAFKYQKQGKWRKLTADHLNVTLKKYNLEPVYGIFPGKRLTEDNSTANDYVDLEQFGSRPSIPIPLKINLSLHWLAIQGVQPSIQENPVLLPSSSSSSQSLSGLSKEYQNLYTRLIGVLSSGDSDQVQGAMKVLSCDGCLVPLLPPLSRHLYSTARSSNGKFQSLQVVLAAIGALSRNRGLGVMSLVPFLGQLVGAVLAILLSPSLSSHGDDSNGVDGDEEEDRIRLQAATTLGQLLATFREPSPELGSRVGRTLIKALLPTDNNPHAIMSSFPCSSDMTAMTAIIEMEVDDQDKAADHGSAKPVVVSLGTITGALMGIRALGPIATKSILLPCLPSLAKILGLDSDHTASDSQQQQQQQQRMMMRLLAARQALTLVLGDYIRFSMQLPSSTTIITTTTDNRQQQRHGQQDREMVELCGLEEQLAPFLAAESSSDSQHFLLRLTF